jgi:hypothetical protein
MPRTLKTHACALNKNARGLFPRRYPESGYLPLAWRLRCLGTCTLFWLWLHRLKSEYPILLLRRLLVILTTQRRSSRTFLSIFRREDSDISHTSRPRSSCIRSGTSCCHARKSIWTTPQERQRISGACTRPPCERQRFTRGERVV